MLCSSESLTVTEVCSFHMGISVTLTLACLTLTRLALSVLLWHFSNFVCITLTFFLHCLYYSDTFLSLSVLL